MLEGAKRLLSKPRKQKEPLSIQTIDAIIKILRSRFERFAEFKICGYVSVGILWFFEILGDS